MNWFKETWLNTMPLADNGNINEIENYNFA